MATSTVFNKTRKGQLEIRNRSGGLSMIERRLLILVDGKRTAEDIWRITKVADYEHLLTQLSSAGFIVSGGTTPAPNKPSGAENVGQLDQNMAPKTFMLTTLRSMASPMHAARVGKQIEVAENREALQALVDTWYQAIADNPANLTRVDGMRLTLLNKLTEDN
ncbi:MAG: hypothetical protein ACR2QW_04255 [bacterium]